jgi:RNA polymerase sigma-70 factor (ECF subfamily)
VTAGADPVADPSDIDGALVAAAQAGDRVAMDRLLRAHQPRIHAVCRRITGNDTDALDATQDALIAIIRGLPRFDGRSRFSTWAYRLATNTCLDELRRRKRRPELGLVDDLGGNDASHDGNGGSPIGGHHGSRSIADTVADRLAIDAALARLAPEFRAAVVLRDFCQLDYAEIAEVLEVPVGTVRSRLARGRGQLADLLGPGPGGNSTAPPERRTPAP